MHPSAREAKRAARDLIRMVFVPSLSSTGNQVFYGAKRCSISGVYSCDPAQNRYMPVNRKGLSLSMRSQFPSEMPSTSSGNLER